MPPPSEKRVPFLGLTGTVAAGKSTALGVLERLGVETLSSDEVVHELLGSERVRDLLVARWGGDVAPDGRIDRNRIGAIVFEDADELAWLEATLHPLVGERVSEWREALPPATMLAVVEVPLLFETGMEAAFDATICVTASDAVRAERAGARGTSALEGRTSRQLSQEEKAARADYVIENDGTLERLEEELARVVREITTETGSVA